MKIYYTNFFVHAQHEALNLWAPPPPTGEYGGGPSAGSEDLLY